MAAATHTRASDRPRGLGRCRGRALPPESCQNPQLLHATPSLETLKESPTPRVAICLSLLCLWPETGLVLLRLSA